MAKKPGTTPFSAATGVAAQLNYPFLLKRMMRLMELSRTLASTLDQAKLLRMIIEAAREMTGTEAASMMLFDPISGDLRFEATTNLESSFLEGLTIPVEGSIAGWIATHAEPLIVPDTSRDPRWSKVVDSKTDFVTRSILGVPLVTREKSLGALEAINKIEGEFTDDDVSLLQTLAAQASVAIVNARLFQQSDQISEMVHELRTPLNSLTATSHLLLHPSLPDPKKIELIKTMQRETGRLAQMTTDFLDLAKLESGRMRFAREPFDLRELIEESVDVVRQQAAEHGLTLETHYDVPHPTVTADRGKTKQVLLNLLTNAVKYNRPNGAIITRAQQIEAMYQIGVSDTGKGIPPDAMAHMFQKFYRVPQNENAAPGTGLGLPIAKKMVEVMGGEIRVESTMEVGTTFYFTLPRG